MEPEEQQQSNKADKQDRAVTMTVWKSSSGKVFRQPKHDLKDCERYFQTKYPKHQSKYKQRKFYTQEELKEMESKLTCGIKLKPPVNQKLVIPEKEIHAEPTKPIPEPEQPKIEEKLVRPPLRKSGPTHFINIPLGKELAALYTGMLEPTIKETLLPLESLNVTLVKFTLKKEEELNAWESLLGSCKKLKISIKGIGMVGVKNRFATALYLNVQGVDDLVDTIMGKAVERQLVQESDNSHEIRFEKTSQMYKIQQPQVRFLQTSGQDLVDAADYLKNLKDVAQSNIAVGELRISVLDSYLPGKGFYNESVIKL